MAPVGTRDEVCDAAHEDLMTTPCPTCGASARAVREVRVRRTIPAVLTYCDACDFLFLRDPHWLAEAYEVAFFGDTGYVQRNIEQARFVASLLAVGALRPGASPVAQGCDLGTGLGLFPRLMRDRGYDFVGEDPMASMALIRPFVSAGDDSRIFTAFEVVEHAISLPEFLAPFIARAELFVFSTLLRPTGVIPDDEWWYYTFPLGQHVSFHSQRSLAAALSKVGVAPSRLRSVDGTLHAVVGDSRWSMPLTVASMLHRRWILHPLASLVARLGRRPSRIWSDHLEAVKRLP
jgi:hypothetical protein